MFWHLRLKMKTILINRPIINIKLSLPTFIQMIKKLSLLKYRITLLFKVLGEKWVAKKRLKASINSFRTLETLKNNLMIQTWSLVKGKSTQTKFNHKQKKKRYCLQVWKVLIQIMKRWCKYFQIKNKWTKNQFLNLRILLIFRLLTIGSRAKKT